MLIPARDRITILASKTEKKNGFRVLPDLPKLSVAHCCEADLLVAPAHVDLVAQLDLGRARAARCTPICLDCQPGVAAGTRSGTK